MFRKRGSGNRSFWVETTAGIVIRTSKCCTELSDKEKQIKVAELNGFTGIGDGCEAFGRYVLVGSHPSAIAKILVPDYLNDLNAMHKVEEVAFNGQSNDLLELEYMKNLAKIKGISHEDDEEISAYIYTATAAQRAEAYVLAMTAQEDEHV